MYCPYQADVLNKKLLQTYCKSILAIYLDCKSNSTSEYSGDEYQSILNNESSAKFDIDELLNKTNLKLSKWFAAELFILTQFTVHYLPWVKNIYFHRDFVERVQVILPSLIRLSKQNKFWPQLSVENRQQFPQWILSQAIHDSFQYERELVIEIQDVIFDDLLWSEQNYAFHEKQLLIYMECNKNNNNQQSLTSTSNLEFDHSNYTVDNIPATNVSFCSNFSYPNAALHQHNSAVYSSISYMSQMDLKRNSFNQLRIPVNRQKILKINCNFYLLS